MAEVLAGRMLLPDGVVDAWIAVEDGLVEDWDEGDPPDPPTQEGWLVPAPVNAHTHVGDAFLRDVPNKPTSVPELVGPGGWKHRQLAMASEERTARGVLRYATEMAALGTTHFLDFREGGVNGARFLQALADELPVQPIVYGRPLLNGFDEEEAEEVAEAVDGIGLSGLRDFQQREDMDNWAQVAHVAGKPLAVHVSEDRHDDIDVALALDPAFVVHMTHGMGGDFARLAAADVPIVVCPRSNRFFGMKTPLRAMLDAGCRVAVGTDNGMLNDGDIMQELALLRMWDPGLDSATLLALATFGGRSLLPNPGQWPPKKGDVAAVAALPDVPPYPST